MSTRVPKRSSGSRPRSRSAAGRAQLEASESAAPAHKTSQPPASDPLSALREGKDAWDNWRHINATADLTGADLSGTQLTDFDLSGILLRNANLQGANLENCRLVKADLSGANLTEARLIGADLTGADCSKACFRNADFTGANLKRARFQGAEICMQAFQIGAHWQGIRCRVSTVDRLPRVGPVGHGKQLVGMLGASMRRRTSGLFMALQGTPV